MKKWKQAVMLSLLAFVVILAAKAESTAAGSITGLKQTDASKTSVKIEWDASLESKYYKVELSEDKVNWVEDQSISANQTVLGLSAGKSYYVRVTGYSDYSYLTNTFSGETAAASEVIEVVTAPECSNMSVVQSDASTTGFSVRFSGDVGANYYQIIYVQNNQETVLGESGTATVKTSSALTPGTSYLVYCYACNRSATTGFVAKQSYDYKSVRLKTLTKKVGTGKFGLTSIWYNIDSYKFSIDAATVGDFDGCQFQFQTPAGKSKKSASAETSSVTIDKFINGSFYKYRVRTYVNCGTDKVYSAWSAFKYIGIPKKVSSNQKNNALSFSWSKVANASKYVVYMSKKENSGYKKIKTAKQTGRSVTVTKFNGKKIQRGKYYIRIYTYAKVGGKNVKSDLMWSGTYTLY